MLTFLVKKVEVCFCAERRVKQTTRWMSIEKINLIMEFAAISIYLVISLLLSLILVGVSFLFASSSNLAYPEKLSAYECGFDPFDDARSRFDIRFYLVSILFIIFGATVSYQAIR